MIILGVSLLEKIDFTDTKNRSCDEMFHLFMLYILYYYQNLYNYCSVAVHSHWTPLDFIKLILLRIDSNSPVFFYLMPALYNIFTGCSLSRCSLSHGVEYKRQNEKSSCTRYSYPTFNSLVPTNYRLYHDWPLMILRCIR